MRTLTVFLGFRVSAFGLFDHLKRPLQRLFDCLGLTLVSTLIRLSSSLVATTASAAIYSRVLPIFIAHGGMFN